MKRICNVIVFIWLILFASCNPNEPLTSNRVITKDLAEIFVDSAILRGVIDVDFSMYKTVEFGMMISQNRNDLIERKGEKYHASSMGGEFKLEIGHLYPDSTYILLCMVIARWKAI